MNGSNQNPNYIKITTRSSEDLKICIFRSNLLTDRKIQKTETERKEILLVNYKEQ